MRHNDEQLLDLFLRLVRIPSPSGQERAVADLVLEHLRAAGLEPFEDDSAGATGASSGNIQISLPGRGAGVPVLLGAHIDTVAVAGAITPVVENGRVRSDGTTILGADDKTAVAVLLALLTDLAVEPPAGGVEVVFTTSEEIGLRGAKALDLARVRAAAGFVLDSSGPLGEVIVAAPSQRMVTAEFKGRAAHAGIEPERGRSAVVAAARAIAGMKLGRIDEQTTANIGVIEGGVASNVVPDRCVMSGEARSRDAARLAAQVQHMLDAIALGATEAGVDVTTSVAAEYELFSLAEDSLPASIAAEALRSIGIEPRFVGTGGGSDVNIFNARGLPSVNLSAGYEHVHSPEEVMPLDRLRQAYELAHAIVAAAGRWPAGV
jgi:tripeptide aminopeptidase